MGCQQLDFGESLLTKGEKRAVVGRVVHVPDVGLLTAHFQLAPPPIAAVKGMGLSSLFGNAELEGCGLPMLPLIWFHIPVTASHRVSHLASMCPTLNTMGHF